jgi:hypothetical protein
MGIKYKKWPQTTPNGHRIYQLFPLKGPPKYTRIGIFGMKVNHLATLYLGAKQCTTRVTIKILKMPMTCMIFMRYIVRKTSPGISRGWRCVKMSISKLPPS